MTTLSGPHELRAALAEILAQDPDSITDDTNLFEAGLDSMALLRLVNRWRRDGVAVDFAELSGTPTVGAWAALLTARTSGTGPADPPATADGADGAGGHGSGPLGVMQHAYWVGRGAGQRLGGVAAHLYTEFDHPAGGGSAVDPAALRAALGQLVRRHETLRSRITPDGRQEVLPAGTPPLAVHDLRDAGEAEIASHLDALRTAFSHQVLDVENGEQLAVALTRLPGGASRLHVDVDMVAADAVSYRLLLDELATMLDDPARLPPPPGLRYADHLRSPEPGHEERSRRDAAVWGERLATLPGAPVLPEVLPPRGVDRTPRVARRHVRLTPERAGKLADAARRHGVTTAMTVAAAFAEVIGAWSTTDHFLLNVPMFDRRSAHPDIDRVVGDFSTSVMLEVDLREPATFAERVRALQQRMHADAAHGAHSGLDVLRELSRRRGEQVLAPVVFTSALNLGELFASSVLERFGEPVWIVSQGPQVLLDAQLTELGGGLLLNWDSREDAFPDGVLDAMFAAFTALLDRVGDDPRSWNDAVALPDPVPGGRVHDGRPVRVVDRVGRDRPDHVPGLLIAADGHDAQRARTWARADGGRVRLLGTDDDRVRVAGVPVGPVEVGEALATDARVGESAVVVDGDVLVAAVILDVRGSEGDPLPDGTTLRADLLRRVPAHLVPARIAVVDRLPRGADGTPAAEAVRAAVAERAATATPVAPRDDLEHVVALVWAEVLGLAEVGVTDEFVALGGDSLLGARIVSRLQDELGGDAVSIRALFRAPTVAGLAAAIRADDVTGRIDEIGAIVLDVHSLSDEEVAAQLGEPSVAELAVEPLATDRKGP